MIAATLTKPKKEKGKGKSKDSKKVCSNKICSKTDHTVDQCFEEGGGKADQPPNGGRRRRLKGKRRA